MGPMIRLETLSGSPLHVSESRCIVRADAIFKALKASLERGDLVRLVGEAGGRVKRSDVDSLEDISEATAQRSCRR